MDIKNLLPKKEPKEKSDRFEKELIKIISEEIQEISNRQSLITLTNLQKSSDKKSIDIFFTVLPENKTSVALDFLVRNKDDIRKRCQKKIRNRQIPYFKFKIDEGELNRQKIDKLLPKNSPEE